MSDGRLAHITRHNGWRWTRQPGTWFERSRFGTNVLLSGPALVQARHVSAPGEIYGDLHTVCVLSGGQMLHWQLIAGGAWQALGTFGAGIATPPCMIEGQLGMNDERGWGNFELCVAAGNQVQHWWRANSGDGVWRQSATFGHDVRTVSGLLQGSFSYNLEVVVCRTDNQLQHYWRDGAGWHEGAVIGSA